MQADAGILSTLALGAFKRAQPNRNSTIKNKVVVCFTSPQDRDYVKSQAFKLAGKKDHSLRLELPAHLLGQHRVLSTAGQELRAGVQGTRTNIKFDDENLRLVLDYRGNGSVETALARSGISSNIRQGEDWTNRGNFGRGFQKPSQTCYWRERYSPGPIGGEGRKILNLPHNLTVYDEA